jgi:hypothetical protein
LRGPFAHPASALVFIRSGFPPSGSPEDLAHRFTSNFAPMLGAPRLPSCLGASRP